MLPMAESYCAKALDNYSRSFGSVRKARVVKLLKSLWHSPIESLSAFVLVAVGVYVSSVGSSAAAHKTGLLTAGGLLTTFGGVLFAWVVSKAFTTEQARVEFQQQLGHLSRNLGQASGQISRAVEQSQAEDISSETGLALISQANRMVYGQVSEISVIQGTGFDPAYLLETATTLDGLARQLESDGRADGELEKVRRQLKEVRTSLSDAARSRTYSRAVVKCPECQATNGVALGDFPGDTASSVCEKCGVQFNAHRASGGAAFSRAAGPAELRPANSDQIERWSFECPSCKRQMSAQSGADTKVMVCFGCYTPLKVNLSDHSVTAGAGTYRHDAVPVVGRQGSRPVVQCPECERKINAFLQVGNNFAGVCHEDHRVLEVPRVEFEAWLATNVHDAWVAKREELPAISLEKAS
jgi:translation initiation factor 2 beta subunit (eIF-2beta)/eIF-5